MRNLGRPGGAAVACSQREVIPELVARLAARGRGRPRATATPAVKKGGVWALSFYDHKLVGAEAFPPPKISAE